MDLDRRFPLLDLSGTPYAMGKIHGQALWSEIRRSLTVLEKLLRVPLEQAIQYAARSLPYCHEQAPELMEEVQGIADGAGLALEQVFALNAGLDLMLSEPERVRFGGPDCWAMAVAGLATAGGKTMVLWTAEDNARWMDACVLLRMQPAEGLPCLMWTFAGFVGRPGLNPSLALSAAAQVSPDGDTGMPYPFICRKALACATTKDAARVIASYERMAGMAYTMGDTSGDLVTLQTTARACRAVESSPGWTACAGRWAEARLARLDALLHAHWGRHDLGTLQQVQRDHGPGSLCAHDGTSATLTAFVCDVEAEEMWLTRGSPCEHEYVMVALDGQ